MCVCVSVCFLVCGKASQQNSWGVLSIMAGVLRAAGQCRCAPRKEHRSGRKPRWEAKTLHILIVFWPHSSEKKRSSFDESVNEIYCLCLLSPLCWVAFFFFFFFITPLCFGARDAKSTRSAVVEYTR